MRLSQNDGREKLGGHSRTFLLWFPHPIIKRAFILHFPKQLTLWIRAVFLTIVGRNDGPTTGTTLDGSCVHFIYSGFICSTDRDPEERKPGNVEDGRKDRRIHELLPVTVVMQFHFKRSAE